MDAWFFLSLGVSPLFLCGTVTILAEFNLEMRTGLWCRCMSLGQHYERSGHVEIGAASSEKRSCGNCQSRRRLTLTQTRDEVCDVVLLSTGSRIGTFRSFGEHDLMRRREL